MQEKERSKIENRASGAIFVIFLITALILEISIHVFYYASSASYTRSMSPAFNLGQYIGYFFIALAIVGIISGLKNRALIIVRLAIVCTIFSIYQIRQDYLLDKEVRTFIVNLKMMGEKAAKEEGIELGRVSSAENCLGKYFYVVAESYNQQLSEGKQYYSQYENLMNLILIDLTKGDKKNLKSYLDKLPTIKTSLDNFISKSTEAIEQQNSTIDELENKECLSYRKEWFESSKVDINNIRNIYAKLREIVEQELNLTKDLLSFVMEMKGNLTISGGKFHSSIPSEQSRLDYFSKVLYENYDAKQKIQGSSQSTLSGYLEKLEKLQ